MTSNLKVIFIAAGVSFGVSVLTFAGLSSFNIAEVSEYFPERIIVKETVKEPQVVEKYIPQTSEEQKIVDIVNTAQDAVVSVIATKDLPVLEQFYIDPFEGFGDLFGGGIQIPQYREKGTEKREVSSGTGFIVSADGLVLTNKHVVSDEDAEFTILMNNGESLSAEVLATDPIQDIAVLKVEGKNLPVLQLGDSDSIEVGQSVIAIGNALGEFRNTVSVGVVSGLKRTITAQGGGMVETLEDLIQTDAAINPGNSGGPLFNLSGEVIGINTATTQSAQNIGFALPINKAKRDLEQVKETGKITYPFLGVRYVVVDADMKEKNNLPVDYGALIVRGETATDFAVVPGSPADKAGIVENDIILEINGEKITERNTLAKIIQNSEVGDTITLKVFHKGDEKVLSATLVER